ncbi:MAG: hypothetical protein A2X49_15170 [Lentisphaerae bacterium GWF2_52_8]|nr:MAG: hypothetical protein A2X49_15170 [Lentisphaerae bacterium GWF2_52_8]
MNVSAKFVRGVAVSAGLLLLFCGCTSTVEKKDAAAAESKKEEANKKLNIGNVSSISADSLRESAEKYMDNILNGLKDGNRALFTSNMIDEMKAETSKELFSALVEKLKNERGTYISREFLGALYQGPFVKCVWKAKFDKEAAKNETPEQKANREKLGNDTMLQLLLGEVDGKLLVFGFQFN